eukprot:gnl/TRDRNA2_/TRDRNA2_42020_c1_seq1.p1 gnl/TRDRNA2_/TRDRNA2_42020_c1~~gnl/TRDRNA2_/TRDRNA2_42020_c1_seq1.p1  ORF type:complete len:205 (-),score=18.67 gnl/TRDRNA2_/TRDRNA2_42020_c1_seq1:270-884(-)
MAPRFGQYGMDHYAVLGVSRDATEDQIGKAYKRLALKLHPDKNQQKAQAEEAFKQVVEAYRVLRDAKSRQKYDQQTMYSGPNIHGGADGMKHCENGFYIDFGEADLWRATWGAAQEGRFFESASFLGPGAKSAARLQAPGTASFAWERPARSSGLRSTADGFAHTRHQSDFNFGDCSHGTCDIGVYGLGGLGFQDLCKARTDLR